jgi:hypothetical protein
MDSVRVWVRVMVMVRIRVMFRVRVRVDAVAAFMYSAIESNASISRRVCDKQGVGCWASGYAFKLRACVREVV